MKDRLVTITGGSGFVGQILRVGLRERGYRVSVVDQVRGPLVDLLRRRYLGASRLSMGLALARGIRRAQKRLEPILVQAGILKPSWDNIMDLRGRVVERFRGSYAVVHLAGIPHPRMPGAVDSDFRRINYDASVNVFEAAREVGVPKFLFASSAQVYGINNPVRIDQLPILESNYCPTLEQGQSMYGWMKLEFERYLGRAETSGGTQSIALRLEYPGFRSATASNFYVSTSIDNLVAGFVAALEAPLSFGFETVNLADGDVDEKIVDIQEFVRAHWPRVPNHTRGNECLLSTGKARDLLGYRPVRNGRYFDVSMVW